VTAAPLAPLAGTAALLAAAPVAFWLDRRRARALGWLAAAAAWGLALPAALRIPRSLAAVLLRAPAAGRALPEAWFASPVLGVALGLVAVALPLVAAARAGVVEGPADGAAVGSIAGLGFAAGAAVLILSPAWQPAAAAVVFVVALHAAAGSLLGAGAGLAVLTSHSAGRAAAVAAAVVAAAALFAALALAAAACWGRWGEGSAGCNLALAAASVVALAAVFAACAAYERRVLERHLAEEVELGVLPAWVVEVVPSVTRRCRSGWWPRRDERREIAGLLVTLGLRKRQLLALPDDRARLYGLEVGRLRQRARTLLAAAPVPPAGAGRAE
jgi:hypothetical protein